MFLTICGLIVASICLLTEVLFVDTKVFAADTYCSGAVTCFFMATKESFDSLHNKVRKYVVKIRCSGTYKGKGWSVVTPGIILLKEDSFCYIVAHGNTFSHDLHVVAEGDPQPLYEVVFPDNNRTTVECQRADVQVDNNSSIAAFFIFNVNLENDMVKAVPFSPFVAQAEAKVYTLCLHRFERDIPQPSYLSPGLINVVARRYFSQDCRPDDFTSWGSPIFDDDGRLVGLCLSHCSVLLACDVAGIATVLSRMLGAPQMTLDILDTIKSKGEAMAGGH